MGEILHIGSVNERTLQRLAGYVCTSYLTACQIFNPVSLLFVPKVGKSERWRVSEKKGVTKHVTSEERGLGHAFLIFSLQEVKPLIPQSLIKPSLLYVRVVFKQRDSFAN